LLTKWAELLKAGDADRLKEQELLGDFLNDVFVTLLGYARPADSPQRFTISREQHVEAFGKFADGVLGEFTPAGRRYVVAIEGKGPTDPLDRPFKSRALSAVDQGYRYAINLPCDWIIVTSLRHTRLYCKGTDQLTYEHFPLADLATNDHLLKKFVFLLGAERVVPATGRCHLDVLREASDKAGRELTRDFYQRYANMREDVFEQLCAHNPQHSRHDVLSATQHLLDRVLFCAFCEDRGLLPEETLTHAFSHRDPYNPRPVWENFRGLFRSINLGNPDLKIPPYNGGLFAEDPIADAVTVPDAVCGHFKELGEYDYRAPSDALDDPDRKPRGTLVDVDILGHIFEQSISDLEQIRNELDGLVPAQGKEKHKTRRKKEGAFYTPAFITRYIVEQTLGQVLSDRFEDLRSREQSAAKGAAAKSLADPRIYDRDALKKAERDALIEFWEAWQEELATIRVLDPACGSGAFLIEAFDHLYAEYQRANDRLTELRKQQPSLFYPDARILQHNLYGVDLNEEAIQICRLSLWIKTAHPSRPLTSLDHTIRVGNSVVDDAEVHPRAFDWQTAFPEVTEAGGFDVVIGNPPYIRQEWLKAYKAHWEQRFKSFSSTADIFTYFYELGLERLRPNGRMGFITSGSWIRGSFGAPLREYLSLHSSAESIVDFGEFQPFEGAEMIRPSIVVLEKSRRQSSMRLFKWLTNGHPPENLSEIIGASPLINTKRFSADSWELESDEVIALREKLAASGTGLHDYAQGRIYRGLLSGLTEAFVVDDVTRLRLLEQDELARDVLRPFAQGTNVRPWYVETTGEHLLAIQSSGNRHWPWTGMEDDEAERIFEATFPSVYTHLLPFRDRAIRRQDQGQYWWELRSCAYWDAFDGPKIVWPDISKLPRFSVDRDRHCMGNTVYLTPNEDFYLLGVLSSWATWFFISKTAQPLRLRGDRWQYRLFTQYMESIPVPNAADADRKAVADLAHRCTDVATERYRLDSAVQDRLLKTFGETASGVAAGVLNNKAQEWWEHSLNQLGAALKTSFKLKDNPFKSPTLADAWEPYLAEKQTTVARLTRELADAEAELNDRVYRLFNLTPDEIRLLQREVEH